VVLREKAAQCLEAGDVQRGRDGECSAVADLSLEPRKTRVREHGDRAEHHPPSHNGYVLGAVRDVGRRDSKSEKGPLHPVADRPTRLGGDLSVLALQLL
jgi:hypothetical protein